MSLLALAAAAFAVTMLLFLVASAVT